MYTQDELYEMGDRVADFACKEFNENFNKVIKYVNGATGKTTFRFYVKKEIGSFDITADDLNTPEAFRKKCIAIFNFPIFPMYYAEQWDTFLETFIMWEEDEGPEYVKEEDLKTVWDSK